MLLNIQIEIDDGEVVSVSLEGKRLPVEAMPNGAMWTLFKDATRCSEIFVEQNYY